jgi:multidrug efflux pump
LRPILMTSLAFILGVVPMVIAEGAGAEMRRALGTAVFSGMLGVTIFGVFLTPVFFFVIQWLGETRFFTSARVQKAGAVILSSALGTIVGLIFLDLGLVRLPGAMLCGFVITVIGVVAVSRLRSRRAPSLAPKKTTTSGGDQSAEQGS